MITELMNWLQSHDINAEHEQGKLAFLRLTDREQKVLTLRLGLNDGYCRTLEEVGLLLGVFKRDQVRQIEVRAVKKLKFHLAPPK